MPKERTDAEWRQDVRNWLQSLAGHDLTDVRGIVFGLGAVITLMASRIPPAPPPAPLAGEKDSNSK